MVAICIGSVLAAPNSNEDIHNAAFWGIVRAINDYGDDASNGAEKAKDQEMTKEEKEENEFKELLYTQDDQIRWGP